MSELDCQAIYGQWENWIPDEASACTTETTNTNPIGENSSVYMLGDSVTVRAESDYEKAFSDKGIKPYINASVGRSWNGLGSSSKTKDGSYARGSQAVVDDQAVIKTASGIVIALGSNGGLGGNPIESIISTIRGINPSAPIWWVNVTGSDDWDGADLKSYMGTFNKALDDAADSENFQIINWATTVAPGSNPFKTPGTAAADPNHMLADGLHPNDKGTSILSSLVAAAVTNGSSGYGVSVSASSVCCVGDESSLQGSDRQEKAFNFFVSKGLTAVQSAAIIGNLMGESGTGINPKAQQDGSDDPEPKPNVGFGIAQWTSAGRQQNLVDFASKNGLPVTDFSLQLNFVWKELKGDSFKSHLSDLRETDDLADAVYIILYYYEAPADRDKGGPNHVKRTNYAKDVLQLYGANATTASGSSVTINCVDSGSLGTGKGKFTDDASVSYDGVDKMLKRAVQLSNLESALFRQECVNANNPNGPNCAHWCAHVAAVAWGYPSSGYVSAAAQWRAMRSTSHGHPGDRNPPVGALLFYDSGESGHVAIYLGNNKVLSNDVLDSQSNIEGGVYITDAAQIEGAGWGLPYLGWSDPFYAGKVGFNT